MRALTFDRTREQWDTSTGMVMDDVPDPGPAQDSVLVKVRYTGFCGTDRGIWARKAFGDLIEESLDDQHVDRRIFGHELLGEIVEVTGPGQGASGRLRVGDMVSTESHLVCGVCYQCRRGEFHVCANEQIIGVTTDGCFADYIRLPAKVVWKTNLKKIRPEVAAVQEPFGNAVHACTATELAGRTVAILGTGAIGQFAILVARALGAAKIIGVEPNPHNAELARRLGCDEVLTPRFPPTDTPWKHDPELRPQVLELTDGVGVDVALEMAGFNDSVNNAVHITRRGGTIVLFGVRNGDAVFEDGHRIIMNGLKLHAVVGRRLFDTWETTRRLLEDRSNGIQDAIWTHILTRGEAVYPVEGWDPATFEGVMKAHPKAVLSW